MQVSECVLLFVCFFLNLLGKFDLRALQISKHAKEGTLNIFFKNKPISWEKR